MLDRLEKTLLVIDRWLSRTAAAVILLVMFCIVCDVFGRYVFSRPLPWVFDLVSIYVVNLVLYFLASEVLRTRSHIELDLRVGLLPPRLWGALQGLAWLALAALLVLAAWTQWLSMADSFAKGEVHPGLYDWPVWVEKFVVALGLTLLPLRVLVRCARFAGNGMDPSVFNSDESIVARHTA